MGGNRYGTNTYLPVSYSRSECLFHARSVAISLVTSHQNHSNLECYCAVYYGQLRNSFVFTHFQSDSSAATSSATSQNGTVPERPSRNEDPTSRIEEQTRNIPTSYLVLRQNLFSEILCILPVLEHELLGYSAHLVFFHRN